MGIKRRGRRPSFIGVRVAGGSAEILKCCYFAMTLIHCTKQVKTYYVIVILLFKQLKAQNALGINSYSGNGFLVLVILGFFLVLGTICITEKTFNY